jgi:hypothetical protein
MSHTHEVKASDVTAWRGMRGTIDVGMVEQDGDFVRIRRGALVLRAGSDGDRISIEITGTAGELEALREAIDAAMTAEGW